MIEHLSGLLVIDKPIDITSFDCIRYIKKIITHKIKISHMGTLDPFATGLIILGLGTFTKKSGSFLNLDKEYIATGKTGILTNTLDLTGELVRTSEPVKREDIEISIEQFGSKYLQTPPIFSALKFKGDRLYQLARKELIPIEELEKIVRNKTREINIYNLELLSFETPYFSIKAHVSHGTYIRSLVNDIAQKAGSCATTYELRRTKVGNISIKDAVQLYEINNIQDIIANLKCNIDFCA